MKNNWMSYVILRKKQGIFPPIQNFGNSGQQIISHSADSNS